MVDLTVFRENGRINLDVAISKGKVKKGKPERKGAREKFWCNNNDFLYKTIFENSYEDFAELIAYELAIIFGIESAKYDLATYENNKGLITENIVKDNSGNIELVSGTDIINIVFEQHIKPLQNIYNSYIDILSKSNLDKNFENYECLSRNTKNILLNKLYLLYKESNISSVYIETLEIVNINKLTDIEIKKYFEKFKTIMDEIEILFNYNENECCNGIIKGNNLFDLWYIVEKYCDLNGYTFDKNNHPIKVLINYFIFDIITSQGDRHADNWSIIVDHNTNSVKISPLYDNSNICNLNRSKTINSIKEYIDLLTKTKLNDIKKERIKERIAKSINHSTIGLKLNPEDIGSKEKNVKQIKDFIQITDFEQLEEIVIRIKKIEEQLDNVFLNIENKIGIEIPEIVKVVVSYTLKNNIELFLNCYEEDKRRRKL